MVSEFYGIIVHSKFKNSTPKNQKRRDVEKLNTFRENNIEFLMNSSYINFIKI